MSFEAVRKLVSLSLAVCVLTLVVGAPVLAQDSSESLAGSLSGRVIQSDGVTPYDGAVVILVDIANDRSFASQPTDEAGVFHIEGAPAGQYALIAETDAGAFLAADDMTVASGANRPVSLTLNDRVPTQVLAPAQAANASAMTSWAKWLIAGGIAVAALVLIDDSTSEETASQF